MRQRTNRVAVTTVHQELKDLNKPIIRQSTNRTLSGTRKMTKPAYQQGLADTSLQALSAGFSWCAATSRHRLTCKKLQAAYSMFAVIDAVASIDVYKCELGCNCVTVQIVGVNTFIPLPSTLTDK